MLYVVTLTYIAPIEKIEAHLGSHKDWLVQHIQAGRILLAGPMEPSTGGIVLVHCADKAELDAILEPDSFYEHKLVAYDVRAFSPALRAEPFPAQWASSAKSIPLGEPT